MNEPSPTRLRAVRRGRRAESLCAWSLRLRGWRVLARDFRVPAGEIDLIARRRSLVAFIEVKARDRLDMAGAAVSLRQQSRVWRAAQAFLAGRSELAGLDCRFDVMLVVPWRLPVHLKDAWREPDRSGGRP